MPTILHSGPITAEVSDKDRIINIRINSAKMPAYPAEGYLKEHADKLSLDLQFYTRQGYVVNNEIRESEL